MLPTLLQHYQLNVLMRSRRLQFVAIVLGAVVLGYAAWWQFLDPVHESPIGAEWRQEAFGKPSLRSTAEGLRVDVGVAPAGLLMSVDLEPHVRYRLNVSGEGGPMTLRVRENDRPYRYLRAPDGDLSFTVSRVDALEVLFYSDTPSTYLVKRLALSPCAECRDDADLTERISTEIPGIAELPALDRARRLLQWAAVNADYAIEPATKVAAIEGMTAAQAFYEYFERDLGGVYCGGQATFFRNVLRLFGIDALTVDFGIPKTLLTHVSVVIPYQGRHYLFDPTFGIYFEANGAYVSLEKILALPRGHREQIVVAKELPLAKRDLLFHEKSDYCGDEAVAVGPFFKCALGPNSFMEIYLQSRQERLKAAQLPLGPEVLLELLARGIFSVGPSLDPDVRAKFIEFLDASRIPHHHPLN